MRSVICTVLHTIRETTDAEILLPAPCLINVTGKAE
jgi:hypothetical protein